MAWLEWAGAESGLNRAKGYAQRVIDRDAPGWLPLGAIPPDSVLVGEGFASADTREVNPDEPWAFGLTEGERSQVRLIDGEDERVEQAHLLRATHAFAPGQTVRATPQGSAVAPTSLDVTPTDLSFTVEPVEPSETNVRVAPEPAYMQGLTTKEKALVNSIGEGREQYANDLKAWRKRMDDEALGGTT
jgi:hypothetical protein